VCARLVVGLAIQLATRLTVGYIASTIGLADLTRGLQAVFIVLIV